MKKFLALIMAAMMLFSMTALADEFDPAGLLDWYNDEANVPTWMTTANGGWNVDIATAPTDEELEEIFRFALKSQTGIHWTETFFLVVRDPATQQGIIGDNFGTLEECANEGTVTVLVLVDNIADQEHHASEYNSSYFSNVEMASFDAGMTCGMMNVAATAMGYSTHYFAYPSGELINGGAKDPSYFINGKGYTHAWGITGKYGQDSAMMEYPLEGNVVLMAAVVIGTKNTEVEAVSAATMYARPDNFAFFD